MLLLAAWLSLGCRTGASEVPDAPILFTLATPDGDRQAVTAAPEGRTVLAFWATYCRPCQAELRELDELYAQLRGRGLELYAISVDGADAVDKVQAWLAERRYAFAVLLDPGAVVLGRYGSSGVPYYVVLDGDGQILHRHLGYRPGDIAELRALLEAELSPPARDR